MANATLTSYDAALKELWPQSAIENLVYKGAPLLAMLSKATDFYGDAMNIAVQHGNPQGRSAVLATAITNESSSRMKKFVLTRVSDYQSFSIDMELIEASKNDKGSLVSALERESKSALENLSRSWHQGLYGDGTGTIGRVGAYTGGATTFTLGTIADVVNFEVDQVLVAAATTTGAIRSGSNTISAVNRNTGVITSGTAWDTGITSFAANDYLFSQGDAPNNSGVLTKVAGLQAWLPASDPSGSDSFFSVNRSIDRVRLAGNYFDGTGLTYEETWIQALARTSRNGAGAKPDKGFMHTDDLGNFITELGSKVSYTEHKIGEVGFEGIKVRAGGQTIDIYGDYQCPKGRAFALTMDSWKWQGLLESPRLITLGAPQGGGLWKSTTDAISFRAVYRGQLRTDAPAYNTHILLPS